MQALELRAHVVAELGVEVGQGLVEEQQPRAADEGPADRDALLLAAARGLGLALQDVPDAQHLRHFAHAGLDLGPRDAGFAKRIGEVLEHGEVRVEGEGLEHHRDPAVGRRDARDVLAVEHDPPAVRRLEPGDDPERRRLAGRARPEQAEELPVPDVEVDAVEGDDRAKPFPHPIKAKVNVRLRARAGFGMGGRAQGPCPIALTTGRSIVQRLRRPVKLGVSSRPGATFLVVPALVPALHEPDIAVEHVRLDLERHPVRHHHHERLGGPHDTSHRVREHIGAKPPRTISNTMIPTSPMTSTFRVVSPRWASTSLKNPISRS